jgi:hypothetical protein
LHVYSSAGSSAKIDFAKGQMDVRFGRITLLALRCTYNRCDTYISWPPTDICRSAVP